MQKEYMKKYRVQKGDDYKEREKTQARNYAIKHKKPEELIANLNKAIARCQIAGVQVPQVYV